MKIRKLLFLALILILSYANVVQGGGEQNIQRSEWLKGVLIKLEKMRDETTAKMQKLDRDIKQNESSIRKSEDIIRRAGEKGNAQAEKIARQALMKARDAKKKNEENYSLADKKRKYILDAMAKLKMILEKGDDKYAVNISDGTYKTPGIPPVPPEKKEEQKKELELPPYFAEGVPPVNCTELLKDPARRNCYCPNPNRAPVCTKDGKELKKEARVYVFAWMIGLFNGGHHYVNSGTYMGTHDSYDEAYKACVDDAKHSTMGTEDVMSGAVISRFECLPM